MRRIRVLLVLVSLTTAVVTGVSTDTASARENTSAAAREPNPPGCDRGAFCAYSAWPQDGWGTLMLETQGNWAGGAGWVRTVYNNGVRWPGADHVQLDWVWPDGTIDTTCIHYNPGPGHLIGFTVGVIVTRVWWRGEC